MKAGLLISVVDDDQSLREALPELLNELGFAARTFSSAEEFLVSDAALRSSCLLLDIGMPVMSGPSSFANFAAAAWGFRLSSSLLAEMKQRGRDCLITERSSVFSNRLTIKPCRRH